MRARLHVISGRLAGRRVRLTPGAPLRVGRGARADVSLTHDEKMASVHFEITFDGAACQLRDIGKQGTSLDGEVVHEGACRDGSFVVAGLTSFLVRIVPDDITARLPPRPNGARLPTEGERERRRQALSELSGPASAGGLYAILDAARDRRIKAILDAADDDSRSLFDGEKGDLLADVAPHLVRLDPASELLRFVLEEGWGDGWATFLVSQRPLDEVRQRLRRSLMVTDEETGKRLFFRFYDPRVLRLFYPTSTARQRSELFGTEIERFVLEGDDGEVIRFDGREDERAHS